MLVSDGIDSADIIFNIILWIAVDKRVYIQWIRAIPISKIQAGEIIKWRINTKL